MTKAFLTSAQNSFLTAGITSSIIGFAEGVGMSKNMAENLGKEVVFQLVMASGAYAAISSWFLTHSVCDKYKMSQGLSTFFTTTMSVSLAAMEGVANSSSWAETAVSTTASAAGVLAASVPATYVGRKVGSLMGKLSCSFWSNRQHEHTNANSIDVMQAEKNQFFLLENNNFLEL